jgi:hypothetical protein
MATVVEEDIKQFVLQVQQRQGEAAAVQNESFRKVLYLVMTDALAKVRFPRESSNRTRFLTFVRTFGDWADGERVSLPQLELALAERTDVCPDLRAFVSGRLGGWDPGRTFYPLANDPLPAEFPEGHRDLEPYQHLSLLWEMRNTLIHEFRHPGRGLDFTESDSPHYLQVQVEPEGPSGWELVMPVGFLQCLHRRCAENLAAWLHTEKRNPWNSLGEGRVWIRERGRPRML